MGLYSDYLFPWLYDHVVRHRLFDDHRTQVLSQAVGQTLEIGLGTGLNLEHYPPSITELFAIDPSAGMEARLRLRLAGHRMRVHFVRCGAENLPFPDGHFDTVVSTLTLCSVNDLKRTLSEVLRVLRPQGRFLVLEHGLSGDRSVRRWQQWLDPVQNVVGCGCRLTVDVEQELRAAGFMVQDLRRFDLPRAPRWLGHVYKGVVRPV